MLLIQNSALRLLFIGQALYWSCSMIGITLTSLVGAQLTSIKALATLPLALLVVRNLGAVQPLSMFMQRHSRRSGLMLGAASGIAGGLICAVGVWLADFVVFCLGSLPIGLYMASVMYYRFAAQEAVGPEAKGRATAYVIGGGLLAAVIAPSLALWSQNALPIPFLGAYLLIALLAFIALLCLAGLPQGVSAAPRTGGWQSARNLLARPAIRIALLLTGIGHGVMLLIMNATPLAMQMCGFSLPHAAGVIQWHVLGMFLPAFIAGPLVDRWGSRPVAWLGCVLLTASAIIALSGQSEAFFLISSFCLGLGWNLMLVAGTTLLSEGHDASERGQAQALMELGNGGMAALMTFASGALLVSIGWSAVNLLVLPTLLIAALALWIFRKPQVQTA